MKKVLLVILSFVLLLPGFLHAQDREQDEGRKKVGVVLSGGGAKGVAHVSALKAIEEAGIPIDYIAGTSMGAIVAGLYAIGYDTNMLDSLFRSQDWDFLIYDKVSRRNLTFREKDSDEKYMLTMRLTQDRKLALPSGLIGGYNIYNLLYELTIGYHDEMSFSDLPIPFACMGYDMVTGESVTLDSGYLPDAIRASMSIPGAFQCVEIGDMVLVDGGIGNNFPVDVIRKMGAEIVIGIDVTSPLKTKEELTSFASIFDQITSFTALQSYRENMKHVDFYVHPDITGFSAASFSAPAIDTLLARGAAAMEEKKGELYALKSKIGISDGYIPKRQEQVEINPAIQINSIYFEGLSANDDSALRRIIRLNEGSTVHGAELQHAVAILMGTGSFSDVRYKLDGRSPYDLTFVLTEKSKNSASFGFRFDSEEMAAVLLNVSLAGKNMTNSRFDVTAKLGNNPYVQGGYTIGGTTSHKFSVSYKFRYYDMSLYVRGKKMSNLDFNHHRVDVNFSNLRVRNFMATAGICYDYYHYRSIIANVENTGDVFSQGLISYYINTDYETLDSKYYPTRGSSFTTRSQLYTNNFISYKGSAPFYSGQLDYFTVITPSERFSLIPGAFGRVLIGKNFAYPANNFVGGTEPGRYMPQQMAFIGLHYIEPLRRSVVGVKLDLRYRVAANNYFSLLTNFAMHNNNFFELLKGEALFGFGVKYSYNSMIGPLDVMLDYSTYDKKAGIFLNIGYYF